MTTIKRILSLSTLRCCNWHIRRRFKS